MSSSSYGQPGDGSGNSEGFSSGRKEQSFSQAMPGQQGSQAWQGEAGGAAGGAGLGHGANEFSQILSDLQNLVARAGTVSGDELTQLRNQIAEKFSDAKMRLGELTDDATAATRRGADATEQLIQTHPFQAVAVAALAGLAIGIILSRR